jgi:hypothetical protein
MRSRGLGFSALVLFVLTGCFGSSTPESNAHAESEDSGSPDAGSSSVSEAGSDAAAPPDSGAASVEGGDVASMGLNLSSLPGGAFSYTQGSYIESFRFTARSAVVVTQLGYYDSNLTGTTQTFGATPVGLYDMTTSTQLGSVTVQPTDPPTGIFRFAALTTPISLNTTDTYAVVAVTGSNHYAAGFDYAGEINPSLTWVSFAGDGSNNLTETSTLVEPNFFWTTTGDIGPNFLIGQ